MPAIVPTHITVDLEVQVTGILPVDNSPRATNDLPGIVQPDGTSILIDPLTSIISASGSSALAVNIKIADYGPTADDQIIQMNAAGATTVTLPVVGVTTGKLYWVKNVGAGTCTVQAASGNIDADASIPIIQWQAFQFYWDGTTWHQLSQSLSL